MSASVTALITINALSFHSIPTSDFLSLSNVIGSPHNSAQVHGTYELGAKRAARNVRSMLEGGPVDFLVEANDKL